MKYILFPIIVFIGTYLSISYVNLDLCFWNWEEVDRWIQITAVAIVSIFSFIAYIENNKL